MMPYQDHHAMLTFLESQFADVVRLSPRRIRDRLIALNHILRVTGVSDTTSLRPYQLLQWAEKSLAGHPACDIPRPLTSGSLIQYARRAEIHCTECFGLESPFTAEVWDKIFAMCATFGKPETPVTPATREIVRLLLSALDPKNNHDKCVACFVTMAYSMMQRPCEILALDTEDIVPHPRGILVRLDKAKNNPECLESFIPVPYDDEVELCPVLRLDAWLDFTGRSNGPVFRTIAPSSMYVLNRRLSKTKLDSYIRDVTARVGLEFPRFGPSAFRRGGVTDGAAKGRSEKFLSRRTRHRSFAHGLARYIDTRSMDDSDYTSALVLP